MRLALTLTTLLFCLGCSARADDTGTPHTHRTGIHILFQANPDALSHWAEMTVGKLPGGKLWACGEVFAVSEIGQFSDSPRKCVILDWPSEYQHDSDVSGTVLGADMQSASGTFGMGWQRAPDVPDQVLDMMEGE